MVAIDQDTMTPTTPARPRPERPIGPTSRVRMPWLAAAVGAALVAAALVLWGLGRVADRREVVVMRAPVAAGDPIPAEALGTSMVAVDGPTQLFSGGQRDELIGRVAASDLAPGDLVGPSAISAGSPIPEGWVEVGGLLPAGWYPSSITVGDDMLAVPKEGDPTGVQVLVVEASVGDDRAALVVVAAPADQAGVVAQWSADDNLVLVRVGS